MSLDKTNKLIEIFAGSSIDAQIVNTLLKGAEIEAFLKDENIGTLVPWYAASGGAGAVKVIIHSMDYERAKLIIDHYEQK